MKKKFKFGVIGAGFMSSAIVQGVINAKIIPSYDIIVSDVNDCALDKMQKLGVTVTKNNLDVALNAEFVFFAVNISPFFLTISPLLP
jgi:pyrroline-5-carboxylate reductase